MPMDMFVSSLNRGDTKFLNISTFGLTPVETLTEVAGNGRRMASHRKDEQYLFR